MGDWVDKIIEHGMNGYENEEVAFCLISGKSPPILATSREWTKEVIREVGKKKEEGWTEENLKKIRFIIIDKPCFNDFVHLSMRSTEEKYDYFIFIPGCVLSLGELNFKNIIAHELVHFLFNLKNIKFTNKDDEEKEVENKVIEWGFTMEEKKIYLARQLNEKLEQFLKDCKAEGDTTIDDVLKRLEELKKET